MIERYVEDIEKLLEKIKQEDNEHINEIINYETSTQFNVGGMLCLYGTLYNVVYKATTYEEVICGLENLKKRSDYLDFDHIYDEINDIENMLIKGLKEGKTFELGTKIDALSEIEHEYILDTILKCL